MELYELPERWVWTTLGEIAEVQSGVGFPEKYQGQTNGDFPVVKVSDISNAVIHEGGLLRTANNYVSMDTAQEMRAKTFPEGSILFAKIGEAVRLNRRVFTQVSVIADNNVAGLIPKYKIVDPKYILYYSHTINLYDYSQATTVPSVRKSDIEIIPLPLPPLPEQERIVEVIEAQLSRIEAGVASVRNAQTALRRYKASVLNAACTGQLLPQNPSDEPAALLLERILAERRERWEAEQREKYAAQGKPLPKGWQDKYPAPAAPDTTNLPELPQGWVWASAEQLSAHKKYALGIGPFGSNLKTSDYTKSGVPLIFVRNIRSNRFDGDDLVYVSPKKGRELEAHSASSGDLLITKMGDPPGDIAIYPDSFPKAIITADCIKWTVHPYFQYRQYFTYFIQASLGKRLVLQITTGVAQKKMSLDRFRSFPSPLAPLAEQIRIVEEVERRLSVVAALEQTIAATLQRAARLRQSVLRKAFRGELVTTQSMLNF